MTETVPGALKRTMNDGLNHIKRNKYAYGVGATLAGTAAVGTSGYYGSKALKRAILRQQRRANRIANERRMDEDLGLADMFNVEKAQKLAKQEQRADNRKAYLEQRKNEDFEGMADMFNVQRHVYRQAGEPIRKQRAADKAYYEQRMNEDLGLADMFAEA